MNEYKKYIMSLVRAALIALIILIILVVGITTVISESKEGSNEKFEGSFFPANEQALKVSAINPAVNSSYDLVPIDTSLPIAQQLMVLDETSIPGWITVDIIPEDCNSRANESLEAVNGIVVHYVANPGISAENNRYYYDNEDCEVNSHFIVGLEGEIIMCVPLSEQSVASNSRNSDTFSIEVCHPDESGEFTPVTYDALTRLTAWLCALCDLDDEDIIRHYDVNEKECPYYYVHNPEAWDKFKGDVMTQMYTEFRHAFTK